MKTPTLKAFVHHYVVDKVGTKNNYRVIKLSERDFWIIHPTDIVAHIEIPGEKRMLQKFEYYKNTGTRLRIGEKVEDQTKNGIFESNALVSFFECSYDLKPIIYSDGLAHFTKGNDHPGMYARMPVGKDYWNFYKKDNTLIKLPYSQVKDYKILKNDIFAIFHEKGFWTAYIEWSPLDDLVLLSHDGKKYDKFLSIRKYNNEIYFVPYGQQEEIEMYAYT